MTLEPHLTLEFSGDSSIELHATRYRCSLTKSERVSVRGKLAPCSVGIGTFQWTSAVVGLVLTLLKGKLCDIDSTDSVDWIDRAALVGGRKSLAASLSFAISKEPNWLRDMFGVDSGGGSIARRLLVRRNSEGKRPGPRYIALNRNFLSPNNVSVYVNGREQPREAIEQLLKRLQSEFRSENCCAEATREVSIQPATDLAYTVECLRLPLRTNEVGIEQTTLSLDDVVLHALCRFQHSTASELNYSLVLHLKNLPGRQAIENSLARLQKQGVVKRQGHSFMVNDFWHSGYHKLMGEISAFIAKSQSTLGNPSLRLEVEESPFAKTIRFHSTDSYDQFMARLLDDVLEGFALRKSFYWQLNHSWWPFVRGIREKETAQYQSKFTEVMYVSPHDSSIDRWVSSFYREVGVQSCLGVDTKFAGDLWICEDLVIMQYLSPELEFEVNQEFRRPKNIDDFDISGFCRALSGSAMPVLIRIIVAPRLAELIRSSIKSSRRGAGQRSLAGSYARLA